MSFFNKILMISVLSLGLVGCATTDSQESIDPYENWNRSVQSFNDDLDEYALKPIAKGYQWVMPNFADQAVSNFFSNLSDIGVTFNDLLQGKFSQSGSDAARFLVNSTAGIGGLVDVASHLELYKNKEDFGQTLGFWGVPTGPYIVLPLFGPSTPRGVAGLLGDAALNPVSYLGGYIPSSLFVLNSTDKRADHLATELIANEAVIDDRYTFFRDAYLSQRKNLVLDGDVPDDDLFELDEDFDEEELAPVNPY